MEFNPRNLVVQYCMQGMAMEQKGNLQEALQLFMQAWHNAGDDFEKYLAAWYVASQQKIVKEKLHWLQTSLQFAVNTGGPTVRAAIPVLHNAIAKCYDEQGDAINAKQHAELANLFTDTPEDAGPFYGAGLAAALAKGDGTERVYLVETTDSFENDPNVTNKKFPGNPTRSYRTAAPLKVIAEVIAWDKQTPEELTQWREKLANVKGDIIN